MKKSIKKGFLFLLVAFAVLCGVILLGLGSTAERNEEIFADERDFSIKKTQTVSGDIVNPVILICFLGENEETVKNSFLTKVKDYFVGEDNSLADYYRDLSYGNITIDSVFPDLEDSLYVYKAPKLRSHYDGIDSGSGYTRYREESALLNGAVKSANLHFDWAGKDLDVNDDGYVDNVSFIVSGASGADWGGLMWPHSWELDTISKSAETNAESLNGIPVNKFTLNFIDSVDVGYICHETGHVFGMPDLYHYDHDKNYVQVSHWDIMHLNTATPQYPTTHLRDRYLHSVYDGQIVDLTEGGEYSLKPTTIASSADVLAYRVAINDKESIYFEYRNNSVGTYDSMLDGSGLIVYRVNLSADGNEEGRHESSVYPDEVYVYRPNVATSGDLRTKELKNLSYAYLSNGNEYFNNLGTQTSSKSYDPKAIFRTNGKNTGIMVKILSQSDEEITFEIDLNGYGSASTVEDIVVEGNTVIEYGEQPDLTVKILFRGYDEYVIADPTKLTVEYDPTLIGYQTATVSYTDGETVTKYNFTLRIKDRITDYELNTPPTKTSYKVGEKVDLSGLSLFVDFAVGGKRTIYYSSANEWSTDGVDTSASGDYECRITYLPYSLTIRVPMTVVSDLKAIKIDEKNTRTLLNKGESYSFSVTRIGNDNTESPLSKNEYTVSTINYNLLYEWQTITVTAKENSGISTTKKIVVVDDNDLVDITVQGTVKNIYLYGERLDLSAGELNFSFGQHVFSVPLNNFHSEFSKSFDPLKKGKQTLNATIFGKERSLSVSVLTADDRMLTSGNSAVTVGTGYAIVDGEVTYSEIVSLFASYLKIRFVCIETEGEYYLNDNLHGNKIINRNVRIELCNDDGLIVTRYRIYIKGDANDDGVADERDRSGWADVLFSGEYYPYLDINEDGKYTLTDYVLLSREYGGSYD